MLPGEKRFGKDFIMGISVRLLSSLEKVFIDELPEADEYNCASALCGESFSFQIAFNQKDEERLYFNLFYESGLPCYINLFEVKNVPVTLPCYHSHDADYLRTAPGLYPDILELVNPNDFQLVYNQWKSLWVNVRLPRNINPGKYSITIGIKGGNITVSKVFTLNVLNAALPEPQMIFTQWFHCDCLASYYKCSIFSEEHWRIIEDYMKNATEFGMNMIMVPLLTPPLDTFVGGERPTVQLVNITIDDSGYHFGFEKLKKYIKTALKCGFKYFEINHLFTQWGAAHAPKVVAYENGVEKRIFGWETNHDDAEYVDFLKKLLTAVKAELKELGVFEHCFFHISDEPNFNSIENYRKNINNLKEVLSDCHTIDALSDYEFYKEGLVKHPIPSTDHIEPFLKNNVPGLWTYYCCCQENIVSNHFISMPGARTRALATALYKYNITGFLHWGYNFYYSQLSRGLIDPFYEVSAINAFPAGDAFIVYPGADGKPISSQRQYLMLEVMQDIRAMQLLESLTDRKTVLSIIEKYGEISFTKYPKQSEQILKIRSEINCAIAGQFQNKK